MTPAVRNRLLLLLLVIAAAITFFALDLQQYLTLSYLKESKESFTALFNKRPLTVTAAYMGIYILVTALSLPGAAVLSLAGAALLGFWAALPAMSFASSIGATLAFIVSRYLLRDYVRRKFPKVTAKVDQGIQEEGAFYLFTLRLIPIFPFFVINLTMGLTGMRVRTFYWVSQLGMLPGTIVFANAGSTLGEVSSVSDVFSLQVLLSFALLGIFPLAAKKGMNIIRRRQGKSKVGVEADTK